ncbi:MAG: EutN/CcmL family microcompartment protein [Chloroflexota bacterium]|nr:EutN/CcmL family microcompartment protein [Chloroflexota bacterium]
MLLARVIGTVVASEKSPGLEGIKFLIVQPLDKRRRPKGEAVVACDGTGQAGPGHVVTIVGAREASQALPERFVPVDWAITSIVDMVDLVDEKEGYREWGNGGMAEA